MESPEERGSLAIKTFVKKKKNKQKKKKKKKTVIPTVQKVGNVSCRLFVSCYFPYLCILIEYRFLRFTAYTDLPRALLQSFTKVFCCSYYL